MNQFITTTPPFETVALERLRVGLDTYVTRHAVLEVNEDALFDQIRIGLRSEVLAQRLDCRKAERVVSFEEPASAWQMFKRNHAESWWLGWLVRRRPVRNVTHRKAVSLEVEAFAAYPDARIALPPDDFGRAFLFHRPRAMEVEQ